MLISDSPAAQPLFVDNKLLRPVYVWTQKKCILFSVLATRLPL